MKVLHLSTFDLLGGAAKAAYRLNEGLNMLDVESRLLVRLKSSNSPRVLALSTRQPNLKASIGKKIDHFPIRKFNINTDIDYWSVNWFPNSVLKTIKRFKPDILHYHWIGDGFFPINDFSKIDVPQVWTMHDNWPFTGGCHYVGNCDRFEENCGLCPKLQSSRNNDISSATLRRKIKNYDSSKLNVVSPSIWLRDLAQKSKVFRSHDIKVIPYGLDLKTFKPIDRKIAREILNIPQNIKVILFGAVNAVNDPRKGFRYLEEALRNIISENGEKIQIVIFGSSNSNSEVLDNSTIFLGTLKDDYSLALAYSAADVFIAPSVEDNLPNTALESLACGTPVVSFNIGGFSDIIDHKKNGFLAKPLDSMDLYNGVRFVLEKSTDLQLSKASREKALKSFEIKKSASEYIKLYQDILS